MNQPFLLRPAAKDYIWGGNRLNEEFGKNIPLNPLAETWECSTHPDGPSMVVSGKHQGKTLDEVIRSHPDYLGIHAQRYRDLPFLVKLIDAKKDLSVQVHPTDEYAMERENGQFGKTEMWYVLDCDKDAKLVYGLSRTLKKEELRKAITNGTLEKYLQRVPIKKDDVFFIKAGTIHAIGAGALIAEIQENSNLTYRLYDYDRVDKNGKKRELHIDKALEVANLHLEEPKEEIRVTKFRPGIAYRLLIRCEHFEVYKMMINTELRHEVHYRADQTGCRVLLCVAGCGIVTYSDNHINLYKGDCLFVPADSETILLHGQMKMLDIRG